MTLCHLMNPSVDSSSEPRCVGIGWWCHSVDLPVGQNQAAGYPERTSAPDCCCFARSYPSLFVFNTITNASRCFHCKSGSKKGLLTKCFQLKKKNHDRNKYLIWDKVRAYQCHNSWAKELCRDASPSSKFKCLQCATPLNGAAAYSI